MRKFGCTRCLYNNRSINLLIRKIWNSYRFFKKRGIATPEYEFFYGNFRQLNKDLVTKFKVNLYYLSYKSKMIFYLKRYSDALMEWTQKFGKTYG